VLSHPADPASALGSVGLTTWVYSLVVLLMVAALVTRGLMLGRRVGAIKHKSSHDSRRHAGVATGRDVRAVASQKALLSRARTLRPYLDRPESSDIGYLLGRSRGQRAWASVEDSILLLGPPRSGKGLHVVINAILDAPGAVITTATRPDNIAATLTERKRRGPVAVFDPQRLAEGLPAGLRWSPVRGCEDPLTAMIRAAGLASGYWALDRRRGVGRLLGRQDPHRAPSTAPRSSTRQPHAS
jgi:type IV secretion system protein VirD4